MNNVKIGVIRPIKLSKFAHFRVFRVKLSCREAHPKRSLHQNGVQGCSGWGSRICFAGKEDPMGIG